MKFSIEGLDQARAVELGLCVADLVLLRWFIDFSGTGAMESRVIDGKLYYWIKYDFVLQELPILSITKDTLYRRLKALVEKGVLDHVVIKESGSYSFYGFGKEYYSLISSSKAPMERKVGTKKLKERSKKITYAEVFSDERYGYVSEALQKFIHQSTSRKRAFSGDQVKKFAEFLREEAGDNPLIAMKIVDQSLQNNWARLYKLKNYNAGQKGSNIERVPHNPENDARDENGDLIVY